MLKKIISGAQKGADQGGLDAAINLVSIRNNLFPDEAFSGQRSAVS